MVENAEDRGRSKTDLFSLWKIFSPTINSKRCRHIYAVLDTPILLDKHEVLFDCSCYCLEQSTETEDQVKIVLISYDYTFTLKLWEQWSSRGLREWPNFCFFWSKNPMSSTHLSPHFSLIEKIYLQSDETCFCSGSTVSLINRNLEIYKTKILSETRILFYFATLLVPYLTFSFFLVRLFSNAQSTVTVPPLLGCPASLGYSTLSSAYWTISKLHVGVRSR